MKAKNSIKLKKCIFFITLFSVFIVFGPGIICCLKLAITDKFPMFFCMYHQKMMTEKITARILHFWLLTGFNYISRGFPFAVAIFYTFSCIELSRLSKYLVVKVQCESDNLDRYCILSEKKYLAHLQCENAKRNFFSLLKVLNEIKNTFSGLVFLQFLNSFLEILRIETVVLMYIKGRWHFDIIVRSLY